MVLDKVGCVIAVIHIIILLSSQGKEKRKALTMSRRRNEPKVKSIWSPVDLLQIMSKKHASKIWFYLLQHPEINDLNNLDELYSKWSISPTIQAIIQEDFNMGSTKVASRFDSARGDTIKLVIELFDGHKVETVIMKHFKRTTVCLSSQVGCQMGCRFCATGTMGIIGDLHAHEIIEQLVTANRISPVRNVVMMGMGEPLNNYDNLRSAIEFFIDPERFKLCKKKLVYSLS